MDRFGADPPRRVEDRVRVEIALGGRGRADADRGVGGADVQRPGIGVGMDRRRPDAQAPAGRGDTAGDLAPVGDQHGREHRPHMRRTPNRVASTGAPSAAEMQSASASRVSEGATTPSSQSRAVA